MSEYFDQLTAAMTWLGEQPDTIFIGQAVRVPGTGMFNTLAGVPMEKRVELPVAENMQLGMAIGLSLQGYVPICIYPRINFMMLAMDQLVNHLDKLPLYSGFRPKVIIRTAVAHNEPMDPGPQHLGDYAPMIDGMLSNVFVAACVHSEFITSIYQHAYEKTNSSMIVEYMEHYND